LPGDGRTVQAVDTGHAVFTYLRKRLNVVYKGGTRKEQSGENE
jgi:hypothetical protein